MNLVRGMQHLNGIYTQAFNRRHDRVRTVKDADRIVVLDQGWTVEDGTHNALRPHGGLYHRLYTRSDTGLEMKGVEATVKTGSVRLIRPIAIHVRIFLGRFEVSTPQGAKNIVRNPAD